MANTMSWLSIAVALVLPFGVAVLVAWPFWGRSRDSLGSGVGSLLILAFAVALVRFSRIRPPSTAHQRVHCRREGLQLSS